LDRPTAPLPTANNKPVLWQFVRFCSVGGLNTGLDLVVFNLFLVLCPTHNSLWLLGYNSIAYAVGASNSFLCNKYWTFRERTAITSTQLVRFALITGVGILCNDLGLCLATHILTLLALSGVVWTNAAKIGAIGGSFLVSYMGMRTEVFASPTTDGRDCETDKYARILPGMVPMQGRRRSLSVVLPAYNEAATIERTLSCALETLHAWQLDFELIVVDDGSTDQTAAFVQQVEWKDRRVRLLLHPTNRGYGEALKTGFAQTHKELVFFMDADGQFALQDLAAFFPFIDEYDAVLGYRLQRQDAWMRQVNAWCWNRLVRFVFGIQVRDIDCAFKLFRGPVLRSLTLESGGAMLNTEILYKWSRRGATYTEVGVHHYPRRGGKATGAHPRVIARALGQLFVFAEKWQREEQQMLAAKGERP
jgi:putative flippase GtrA